MQAQNLALLLICIGISTISSRHVSEYTNQVPEECRPILDQRRIHLDNKRCREFHLDTKMVRTNNFGFTVRGLPNLYGSTRVTFLLGPNECEALKVTVGAPGQFKTIVVGKDEATSAKFRSEKTTYRFISSDQIHIGGAGRQDRSETKTQCDLMEKIEGTHRFVNITVKFDKINPFQPLSVDFFEGILFTTAIDAVVDEKDKVPGGHIRQPKHASRHNERSWTMPVMFICGALAIWIILGCIIGLCCRARMWRKHRAEADAKAAAAPAPQPPSSQALVQVEPSEKSAKKETKEKMVKSAESEKSGSSGNSEKTQSSGSVNTSDSKREKKKGDVMLNEESIEKDDETFKSKKSTK